MLFESERKKTTESKKVMPEKNQELYLRGGGSWK